MTSRRRLLLIGAVLGGILVLLGGWLAVRVVQAAGALDRLSAAAGPVIQEPPTGDASTLTSQLPALRQDAARARSATEDPIVRAASHLPWIGDDLRAVSAIARSADQVLGDPAHSVLELVDGIQASDVEGGVDLTPVAEAGPGLGQAATALADLGEELATIEPDGLVGPVRSALDRLSPLLTVDPDQFRSMAQVADILPELLALDDERHYLVLALNPAELRAQGGIVGSVLVLTVSDGVLTLTDQRGTADMPELDSPALPLTEQEQALYGDRLGRWIQDVVLSPDFPRAAELAAGYWEQSVGQSVDGVLATDPVALTAVLSAAGEAVSVDGQQVAPDQLIGLLLREAYLAYGDPRDGDAFYARTAAAAFSALTAAMADPAAAVSVSGALVQQVETGRLRMWSADPVEQRLLSNSALAADFLSGTSQGAQVGVFLDDITAGKLGADLDVQVSATIIGCTEAVPTARIAVRLDYDPPADIAQYPAQVLGDGGSGVPAGWIATNLSVYSARGGDAAAVTRDGLPLGGETAPMEGRSVQTVTARLAPGQSQGYVIELPAPGGEVSIWTTPTVDSPGRVHAHCE